MNIKLTNRARKDIQKLSAKFQTQVVKSIQSLTDSPLKGIRLSGAWDGYRRIRSGDFRIIYRVTNNEITIHYVRNRKEAYRRN